MKNRKIFFGILIGLIIILLAGCSAEEKIKGTWYIIDADKEVTLDIFDETAVYHNNGRYDDYYIEWTLDDDNLVLNMEGESFYYQVLDNPDYGQVLYDPDEERIYACHEQEKAQSLINAIFEERERKRQENLQVFEEIFDEVKSMVAGTWESRSEFNYGDPMVWTYTFNTNGTYEYSHDKYEHEEGTYEIRPCIYGTTREYTGEEDPYEVEFTIVLSNDPSVSGETSWTMSMDDLREGNFEKRKSFARLEFFKIS